MPGAAARNPESAGTPAIFTAPVLHWLLQRQCRGVHVLVGASRRGDSDCEWITAPVGPHGNDVDGWCFRCDGEDGSERRLLLAFAQPEALSPRERAQLAGYLEFATACADAGGDGDAVALLPRDEIGRHIHDLRNALNSLLMNVAVIATKLPPKDRAGRFATQAQADGERCAARLQALAEAIRPADAPLAR